MKKFESKPLAPLTISSELGGKSVTSIGEDAFEDCDSLTSVIVENPSLDLSKTGIPNGAKVTVVGK